MGSMLRAFFMRPRCPQRRTPGRPATASGRLALLTLVTILGACTLGPDFERPGAAIPHAYKEVKGWKIAAPRDDIDRAAWWAIYHNKTLDGLERQVEVSNQTLAAAEAAYRQAAALVQQARAALFRNRGAALQPHAISYERQR